MLAKKACCSNIHTLLELIPKDWESIDLGDFVTYTKGFPFKATDYKKQGIRVIRVSDTTYSSIKDLNEIYVDEQEAKKYSKWQLKEYDLIFSTVGSKPPLYDSMVGRVIIVDKSHDGNLLNQNAVIIRARKKTKQKQQLLLNYFRTKRYLNYIEMIFRGNANQASITLNDLFKFKLLLPKNEAEQNIIAKVLSDADYLIEALGRLIEKKKCIKQGAMQELLTGKKRLPGFFKEWKNTSLGNLGTFRKGSGLPKKDLTISGSVRAIPYTAIFTDFNEIIKYEQISNFTSTFNTTFIEEPHLLIAGSSNMLENVGKATAYYEYSKVAIGGDIILFKTQEDVRFISYLLNTNSHRNKIVDLSQGSTIRHVYISTFESYEISIPNIQEQIAIVQVLTDMDSEIETLELKRKKYRLLKVGLMQQLLTGRIRIKCPS